MGFVPSVTGVAPRAGMQSPLWGEDMSQRDTAYQPRATLWACHAPDPRVLKERCISPNVKEIKTASSKWLKEQGPAFADFYWQLGYGAFSVSMSQKETLLHYIDTQEEHHKTRTFQDDYRDFLKKNGIDYDERYVWD